MALPPHNDPGRPDSRSPGRYLWWLVTCQWRRVLLGGFWSSLWMAGLAVQPLVIRGAIDDGMVGADWRALVWWAAGGVGLGLAVAAVGVLRHRIMTIIRTDAAYRTVQVVTRHVAQLGAVVPRRLATGEVVTIGTTDITHISQVLTIAGPGVGAVVACVVIAVLLLNISPVLGLLVLVGMPALTVLVGPLMSRLRHTETEYRHRQGELTARAGDIVAGLRVLRGIGGEALFSERYRERSQALRAQGYRVGAVTSWVRALAFGLPGLFVALVMWLAARLAVQGDITVGDLVAVYAYAAVLVWPTVFLIDGAHSLVRGLVCARRVINVLSLEPDVADSKGAGGQQPGRHGPAELHDPASGLTVRPGELLGVASANPAQAAALADRFGRYTDSTVRLDGTPLSRLPLAEVRRRILVAEPGAYLFAGTLRDMVRPARDVDEAAIARCLAAAAAEDIVEGLPDGLDTPISGQARTLSGGQRQRIRLARALLADPEILILLEPTSAVDAHTEAAIADPLRRLRAGRSTVVATTSPLLLDQADRVAFLEDGQVVASGSHAALLSDCPGYRDLVTRGAQDSVLEVAPAGPERDR